MLEDRQEPASVPALASTPMQPFVLPPFDRTRAVAVLTLEQNGQVLSQNTVYFASPRDLQLPTPKIASTLHADATGYTLELNSPVLARAVQLEFGDLDVKLDDNFFDLLPNQPGTSTSLAAPPLPS